MAKRKEFQAAMDALLKALDLDPAQTLSVTVVAGRPDEVTAVVRALKSKGSERYVTQIKVPVTE